MPHRFGTGDVFWAPDPYHGDDPFLTAEDSRPWLVVSTPKYPRQGEDYLCCALTSYSADHPEPIRLDPRDWLRGSPRKPGQIDPLTVFTLNEKWAGPAIGHVSGAKVNLARKRLRSCL